MRKPDQNGRSFERASPFVIAADANSRTPKWKLRPPRSAGPKSPAPSKVNRVFVEGARSAAPPTSHGTPCATAFSTCPEESRLASPFGSAGNVGMPLSHPSGSARRCMRSISSARSGWALRYSTNCASQALRASAPRAPIPSAKCSTTPSGTRNCASSGQPKKRFAALTPSGPSGSPCAFGVSSTERSVADVAVDDDQRRSLVLGLEGVECALGLGRGRWRPRSSSRASRTR